MAPPWSSLDIWKMRLGCRSLYPFALLPFAQVPREQRAKLRVLDLPAGDGVLSYALASAGFDVVPADLFPEYFLPHEQASSRGGATALFKSQTRATLPAWLRSALFGPNGDAPTPKLPAPTPMDMEARLPIGDASVDYLLCVEGIEHVMDRHKVLSEFRRVLKPGGTLVLTTPNLLSYRARLAYMLAGQRAFSSYIDEYTSVWGRSDDGQRTYHGHAFLVNYFQVRYSLYHTGFRIKALHASNASPSSLALTPSWPLVALGTWYSQRRAKKKHAKLPEKFRGNPPPYGEMTRHLLGPNLLYNATLVVEAQVR
jgi:SAM-dependent methyltransferase